VNDCIKSGFFICVFGEFARLEYVMKGQSYAVVCILAIRHVYLLLSSSTGEHRLPVFQYVFQISKHVHACRHVMLAHVGPVYFRIVWSWSTNISDRQVIWHDASRLQWQEYELKGCHFTVDVLEIGEILHIFPSGTKSMGGRGSKKAYMGPRTGIYLPTKFGCDRSIVVGCRSRNDRQTSRQTNRMEWQ